MIRLRRGKVVSVDAERPGLVELTVHVEGRESRALAYPELTGPLAEGDTVVLNTTAVALGLGTGGVHLVMAVEGGPDTELRSRGRVMKGRYTPFQTAVQTVEESHGEVLEASPGLEGLPVVVAPLHSMIAPVAAGAKAFGVERVAYVMTDGAALPGTLSGLVPRLRAAQMLDGFITCGQAFGGELEAATIWTALLAAKEVLDAEVVIVADGPGNLGTETKWGVSALGTGHALAAAASLGGQPVAALRVSFADRRERHRGISHHSITILSDVCHAPVTVAVPRFEDPERGMVWEGLRRTPIEEKHHVVEVSGLAAMTLLEARGVRIDSMGRSYADDPAFFQAAGAAGVLAGRMVAAAKRSQAQAGG